MSVRLSTGLPRACSVLIYAAVALASSWLLTHIPDEYTPKEDRGAFFVLVNGPEGASYLYYVDGEPDAQRFERYLASASASGAPGAIDLWLGGHTHTHPDDRAGGRSHLETKWGVRFINCAALTRYHGKGHSYPMSRLLTFTEGSDLLRVQCYLHTSDYAPQGWYAPAERILRLSQPFIQAGCQGSDRV